MDYQISLVALAAEAAAMGGQMAGQEITPESRAGLRIHFEECFAGFGQQPPPEGVMAVVLQSWMAGIMAGVESLAEEKGWGRETIQPAALQFAMHALEDIAFPTPAPAEGRPSGRLYLPNGLYQG